MGMAEMMQKQLEEKLGICVPMEEIAVESVELFADEMDARLVPKSLLRNPSAKIQAEMASYWTASEEEFLYIRLKIAGGHFHEVWMKNDEVWQWNS